MNRRVLKLSTVLSAFLFIFILTSCGGGGGGSDPAPINPPSIPTDLMVGPSDTVNDAGPMKLTWTESGGAESYLVYRCGGDETACDPAAEFPAEWALVAEGVRGSVYLDKGATKATSYSYRIQASNSGGKSEMTGLVSAFFLKESPLELPGELALDATSEAGEVYTDRISVTWSEITGAKAYKVYRSTEEDGEYSYLGTVAAPHAGYVDKSVATDIVYFYKIVAVNADDIDSAMSGAVQGTTDGENGIVVPLEWPANVAATTNLSGKISVSWDAVTEATGYHVYRSTSPGDGYEEINSVTVTSFNDEDVDEFVTYYYRIVASRQDGEVKSDPSTSAQGTLWRPAAPGNVTASITNEFRRVSLSWDAAEGASGYQVYRSNAADGVYALIGTTAGTSYDDNDVSAGTSYFYKVKTTAEGDSIAGRYSDYAEGLANLLPAPGEVAASDGNVGSVTVTWGAVEDTVSYTVYRSPEEDGEYTMVAEGVTDMQFTDASATIGATYWYRVASVGAWGEGDRGTADSGYSRPASPANTAASTSHALKKVALTWNAVTGATAYDVYRSTAEGGPYTAIALGLTAPTHDDTNVVAGMTYYYRVRAKAGDVESDYGSAVSSRVDLPAGPGAAATDTSVNKITVSWPAVSGAQSYNLYRSTDGTTYHLHISGITGTSQDDTGLVTSTDLGVTYWYRVAVVTAWGTGSQGTGDSGIALPATPSGLSETSSNWGNVDMTWGGVTGNNGYEFRYKKTADSAWTMYKSGGIATMPKNSTSATLSDGFNWGSDYDFQIRTIAGSARSAWSGTLKVNI